MTHQLTDITQVKDLTPLVFSQLGAAYEAAGALYMDIIQALNDDALKDSPPSPDETYALGKGCEVLCGLMGIITKCWTYQIRPWTLRNICDPFIGVQHSHTLARYKRDLPSSHDVIVEVLSLYDLIKVFDEKYDQLMFVSSVDCLLHDDVFIRIFGIVNIFLCDTWHELPIDKMDHETANPMFQQLIEDGLLVEKVASSYEMD